MIVRLAWGMAAVSCAVLAAAAAGQQPQISPAMSFFVTSSGRGFGANLGGLAGADAHCQRLAAAVGRGDRLWRAYLSAPASASEATAPSRSGRPGGTAPSRSGRPGGTAPSRSGRPGPAVHARDRIGKGPWVNAAGVEIAASVEQLHGDDNAIAADTALTEKGTRVASERHDILTGSNPDGTLAVDRFDTTCNGWTSYDNGRAMLGHHNRSGGGQRPASWNSAHLSRGCSQRALRASLGDGLVYCFAAD
jgi:hypothetical protein